MRFFLLHLNVRVWPLIIMMAAALLFGIPVVQAHTLSAAAASRTDYQGKIMVQSTLALSVAPGKKYTYRIGVKNVGHVTWKNSGSRFVSVYTYFPKYRESVFRDTTWYRRDQPAKLIEAEVKPGELGYLEFVLNAPTKVGAYEEGFYLAAENFAWITGTQFKIPITVSTSVSVKTTPTPAPSAVEGPTPAPTPVAMVASQQIAGALMIKSFQDRVLLAGGQSMQVTVGFKNNGTATWQERILRIRGTTIATTAGSFAHPTWPNSNEPMRIREPISSGNIAYFTFSILGPAHRGDYTLPLKLVVDETEVPGAEVDIPVTVTEDAPQLPVQEIPITPGGTEPTLRVGLWKPTGTVLLANSVPFEIRDSAGNLLATIPAGTTLEVYYNRPARTVHANAATGAWASNTLMRFVPTSPTGLFRVPNFEGWFTDLYENKFRGTLELNYYAPSDNVWLIEELPIEEYLRGLAETSNVSAYEYQKALVVAARTYAYFVHSIGGKYSLFDVRPTDADQVYRAYGSETVRPSVVRAVEETRGLMVTYNNEIVVTPYYSRSDGRTRSWQEVWCCKVKPWLISVPVPPDTGKTLWGHGVGMSASGALGFANEGKTYDWILKYFYTGIELRRIY